MPGLSDIAQIIISISAAKLAAESFNVPLILGCAQRFPELVRSYSSSADMLTDGFLVTDPEYLMAVAIESQNKHPDHWLVGRRTHLPTQKTRVIPTVLNGKVYKLKVGGQEVSFTSDPTATLAEILAGLKAAVDALALAVTTDITSGTQMDITANAAGAWFQVKNETLDALSITQVAVDGGVASDLAAIVTAQGGAAWFGLLLTHHSKAEILAAAAWIEANSRVFIAVTEDDDTHAAGSGDVISAIQTAKYANTFPFFHEDSGAFAGAALVGATFSDDPGSNTFAFKQLAGIAASQLSASQVTQLQAKGGSYYVTIGGMNLTQGGKVGSGEWLDIIVGRFWLIADISGRIVVLQANNKKIPFTDDGIALVKSEVLASLKSGLGTNGQPGFIATDPAPTVTAPRAKDVSSANKTARTLPNVGFTAYVQGAVHLTKVTGSLVE